MTSSESPGPESHSNGPTFSLENILGNDHDKLEHPDIRPEGWDEEDVERQVAHGYCVECEGAWYYSPPAGTACQFAYALGSTDQPAQVRCETCADDYCEVCFAAQHRKGSRKSHNATPLADGDKSPSKPIPNGTAHAKSNGDDVCGPHALLGPL